MAEKILRKKFANSKNFISRAVWLSQDWQREFDKWVEEISLLLISHSRKTFFDHEWQILNPIQDEARQAKRQNNMLGHRAALERYTKTATDLLAAEARADTALAGGDETMAATSEACRRQIDEI